MKKLQLRSGQALLAVSRKDGTAALFLLLFFIIAVIAFVIIFIIHFNQPISISNSLLCGLNRVLGFNIGLFKYIGSFFDLSGLGITSVKHFL